MSQPFHFKQFSIEQDQCAMKIGTDGVLLGAWTPLNDNPESILDIGSGTGIIALQIAQRSAAEIIDAVEIDGPAYQQCTENFENSPWNDRLFCYHASIQEFASEIEDKYDLIITNPPFYTENNKAVDKARATARFNDALPFDHLIICASHLLSENGRFSLIIPKKEESTLVSLAEQHGLSPLQICRVHGTPDSEAKRSMIVFSKQTGSCQIEKLVIENTRHNYTDEYLKLVRDFYLKM